MALQKLAHFHALAHSYGKAKGIQNFEDHFPFLSQELMP
jgi:hypothetical protein